MLIPFGTDAPIYHFPFATIALIVVNFVMYFATTAQIHSQDDVDRFLWLILEFDKIQPMQWVTNNFMHADFFHILGNMFFLWAFGLIVEGKLGWWRFLLIYLLIGSVEGACVLGIMFLVSNGQGGALGASGAIFGVMAVAMLWAPKNDIHCLVLLAFRVIRLDLPVIAFAAFGCQERSFALPTSGQGESCPEGGKS